MADQAYLGPRIYPDSVGKCEKCGREFLSMPKDGFDHYDVRSGYNGRPKRKLSDEKVIECRGRVIPLHPSHAPET